MNRRSFLDWLAILFLILIYGGYCGYLAHMYATTGGHW